MRAVDVTGCRRVLLGGGVAANQALRSEIEDRLGPAGRLFHASPRLSLDNAAMVARCAAFRGSIGEVAEERFEADAALAFPILSANPA
jgi:N6-L-threonylcarbamoyladenine synthase